MSFAERAASALREAESSLRGLLAEAAAGGDYGSVVLIAAWGRTISEMLQGQPGTAPSPALSPAPRSTPRVLERQPKSAAKNGYPRFYRQGDRLVRVAWSKREKREYEQKAPYAVIEALIAAITELGSDGRIFGTDKLLPLTGEDDTPFPDYQAYLGLALFKHAGLIDQHGRQGYSVPNAVEFPSMTRAVWKNLPTN